MYGTYKKKPIVIEAMRLDGYSVAPDWWVAAMETGGARWVDRGLLAGRVEIATLEGVMTANIGDWVIRGIKGELYPCRADIFAEMYEPA